MDLDFLSSLLIVFDNGIELLVLTLFDEQLLDRVVVEEIFLRHFKHLQCLLLTHKAAINSKSFRSNYFAAAVALTVVFAVLFL